MNQHQLPYKSNKNTNVGARQIAGVYLLMGGLWILFSDRIAAQIALNEEMLAAISLYKGWGFVIITAFMLYWLIQRNTSRLMQSEEKYKLLAENITDVIWVLDLETSLFRYISPSLERLRGYTAEEVLTQPMAASLTADSAQYLEKVLHERLREFKDGNDRTYTDELEQPRKDGTTVWTETTTRFVVNKTTGKIEVYGVSRDISERKHAAEELRLWADAFEGCAHGIAIGDPVTNRIVVCNPAFAAMHKSRVEDIVGSAILSLYAPSDHEHVRHQVQRADQIGHSSFEARMIRKDRSTFPVQMDLVSVLGDGGGLLYRVATAQDISERKSMDEKLRQSETKHRTLVECLPAITYISDPDQYIGVTYISPQIETLGFDVETWLADPEFWFRQIHPDDKARVLAELERFEAGEEPFKTEYRLMLPNGEVRWFQDESIRVKDQSGKTVLKQGFMLDITERKQAEEKIMIQAHWLEQINEAVITSDKHLMITAWNPAAERVYGWKAEEVRGKSGEEVLRSEFFNKTRAEVIQELTESGEYSAEITQLRKDGSRIHVETRTVALRDNNGHIIGYLSVNRDITESKKAEEYLRRFELLSEHSRDIILFIGFKDGRILESNAAALRAYGYSRDELLALTVRDLRANTTQSLTDEQMAQADAGGILFETIHQRKDGTTFPVEVSSQGATIGNVRTLISVVRDITERRQTKEALRIKDDLLHLTSKMAKVGGWEFDPETGKGTWTDEVARIHDLDPEQETSVEMGLNFYIGESRQKVEQAVKEAVELAKPYDLELEMVTAQDNRKWVRTMALPILRDGKVIKVQGIFQDITERKQIEKELQSAHDELEIKVQERTAALSEANALLQALMDNMPDHIYFKDTQGRFIRNSRSQANLLGLADPAQVVGKTDFDFFPHAARAYAEEQDVMRSGKPLVNLEEWVVWPDGREMWVSTTKLPLRNAEGQTIGIFGISHDITERKQTEQAIRQLNANLEKQAEQLQSANKELEAFSYSVSHDLRAPLRAIDGYTRILVEDYEANLDSEGKRICSIISTEARRMGQLIDDLLAFSRLGRKQMFSSKIDMKALATSVFEELAKDRDRERIDFQIAKLPSTKGDLSLMRQVWVNLIANAIKFTSKRERAVIEVGSKQNKEENIYYVRDNGAGFDMEYANKLFGVFQRLHGESEFEGTGVGLAIVQRIIRRHGGRVWAEGEVEKGATFYFALPRKENHS